MEISPICPGLRITWTTLLFVTVTLLQPVHSTKPSTGLTSTSKQQPAQTGKYIGGTHTHQICTCIKYTHIYTHKSEKIALGNECQISYTIQAVWIANKLLKNPAQLNMTLLGSLSLTHTLTHTNTHTVWFSCL